MILKNILTILFVALIFTSCGLKNTSSKYDYKKDKSFPNKLDYNYQIGNINDYEHIYKALKIQYKNWKGVRYKYAGNTKNGIDCSAFVQKTFKDKLNINIPRTTKLQSKIGKDISMKNIEIGDLIFFKTGYKTRHVGIYLGEGKFLHVSTKKGVTISRLDNPYNMKSFWKIKRVIP